MLRPPDRGALAEDPGLDREAPASGDLPRSGGIVVRDPKLPGAVGVLAVEPVKFRYRVRGGRRQGEKSSGGP